MKSSYLIHQSKETEIINPIPDSIPPLFPFPYPLSTNDNNARYVYEDTDLNKVENDNGNENKNDNNSNRDYIKNSDDDKCKLCNAEVLEQDKAIQCDKCQHWFHIKFIGMPLIKYEHYQINYEEVFEC